VPKPDRESEDYFNLGSPKRSDEFALGEPEADADDEAARSAPRALFIVPLALGFLILFALMVGVYIFRAWDRTPGVDVDYGPQQDVKIVEAEPQTEKSSSGASAPAPNQTPAQSSASAPPPAQFNAPVSEAASRSISAVLPELTPAVGMVLAKAAKGISSGSGFIIRNDGLFVTNYHVIDGATEIAVKLNDRDTVNTAYIDRYDAEKDIAVLKFREAGPYPLLELESASSPQLGEDVIVLGYPLGTKLGLDLTVSTGIVSSLRNYPEINLIQTNAAINHGNSGGPMICRRTGRVIGTVTSKMRDSDSIGFAINVNELKKLLDN
jgi:S1-C subfamily serine protease